MSISILGVDGNPWTTRDMDASSNNVITTYHKLGFSGNYVSGGDTLDFTSIAGLVPSGALPVSIFVDGLGGGTTLSGAGGFYGPVAGAALNKAKSARTRQSRAWRRVGCCNGPLDVLIPRPLRSPGALEGQQVNP